VFSDVQYAREGVYSTGACTDNITLNISDFANNNAWQYLAGGGGGSWTWTTVGPVNWAVTTIQCQFTLGIDDGGDLPTPWYIQR